MTVELRIVAG